MWAFAPRSDVDLKGQPNGHGNLYTFWVIFLRSSVFFATVGATAGGVATGCFFVVTEFHVEKVVNTAIGTK
jgi:hypothetical protein